MSKARTLADFVSDGSEFADGTISVAEVSGAAPLASPSFTGTVDVASNMTVGGNDTIIAENNVGFKPSGAAYFDHHTVGQGMYFRLSNASSLDRTVFELGPDFATFNNGGHNQDFRVESDSNTHALFVDAGNNYVIIGGSSLTNAPNAGGLGISAGGERALSLQSSSADTLMLFRDSGTTVPPYIGSFGNDLAISGYGGGSPNVGIGITSPSSYYSNDLVVQAGAEGGITISSTNTTNSNYFMFADSSSGNGRFTGYVQYDHNTDTMILATNTAPRLHLDGAEVTVNEQGNDTDFRVESDTNTHMLFVDAGSNHVNIGGSTDLSQVLNVHGGVALGTDPTVTWNSNYIKFQTRSGSVPVVELLASAIGNYAPRLDIMDGSGATQHSINGAGDTTFNETGANFDFRVESDTNTHALFVDAGNNQVLVGTNTPITGIGAAMTIGGLNDTRLAIDGTNSSGLYLTDSGAQGITIRNASGDLEFYGIATREFVFNEDGADTDFRVESNNYSTCFKVDAGNDTININSTTLQNASLSIAAKTAGTSSNWGQGGYTNLSLAIPNVVGQIGQLGFVNLDSAGADMYCGMGAVMTNGAGVGLADLVFFAKDNGSNVASKERMRILGAAGHVVINDQSYNQDFRVESENATHAIFVEADSAYVKFGKSSDTTGEKNLGVMIGCQGSSANGRIGSTSNSPSWFSKYGANGDLVKFHKTDGTNLYNVGSISVTTTATAYNTSSDYRLKENVVDLTGATARLKQLAPKRFNFIADADTTVDGFLAHEAQTVVPEAVHGTHNEVDADGNPVYQGIDQAKLVPLLVATIKELEARITALENA